MKKPLFQNLPSHIIIDILARLPIRTIIHCKCVCKPWLNLLETHEFVNHHLSKSAPSLAVYQQTSSSETYKIYEFEDDLRDLEIHDQLHFNLVTAFKLPFNGHIQGSANGFLFLRDFNSRPHRLFLCNPITREYIQIHNPKELDYTYPQVVTYGFGASRASGQNKVVRVFHDCVLDPETYKLLRIPKSECHVYTLGTGSWRSITPSAAFRYSCRSVGAFLNGNLHWLVFDSNDDTPLISCFDLETEVFSIIPSPPFVNRRSSLADVFALENCLCLCDNTSDNEIIIWLMKEYGVEKSWTKEFVIPKTGDMAGECYEIVRAIKVFEDGEYLMAWGDAFLFYSSCKTRSITPIINMFESSNYGDIDSILHTSSFLSLKCFGMERVSYFSFFSY